MEFAREACDQVGVGRGDVLNSPARATETGLLTDLALRLRAHGSVQEKWCEFPRCNRAGAHGPRRPGQAR
ncbi:hypothetical protein GCM10020295_13320 [Streptomyces cinereospinus]